MTSLTTRFFSAAQWNIAIAFVTILVQLGITAIVARLLTPSDFGQFAIANIIFIIGTHLGERGLTSSIIREPVLEPEIIGSAVLLSCALSTVLTLSLLLLAPLAAIGATSNDGALIGELAQFMCLAILISGIGAPAQALMQRELRFRELGLVQFTGILLGTGAATILLALAGYGPWSLAFGAVVNTAIVSAGCWWILRGRSMSWHGHHVIRVGVVGVKMTLLRVLDAFWTQLPLFVAHIQLSSFDVGLYQRAQALVDIGINSTSGRVSAVLFPVMASRQDNDASLRSLIPLMTGIYALFLFPVAAFIVVSGPDLVLILLGPKWQAAAAPLVLIMIAFAIVNVSQPASSQLEAVAAFAPRILGSGIAGVSLVLLGWVLAAKYALIGIAIAAVISALAWAAVTFGAIARRHGIAMRDILSSILPGFVVAVAIAVLSTTIYPHIAYHLQSAALRLLIMATIAAVTFILVCRVAIGRRLGLLLAYHISSLQSPLAVAMLWVLGLSRKQA
jgi:lipopolysaccharide exporter